jgi:hypothetical protein
MRAKLDKVRAGGGNGGSSSIGFKGKQVEVEILTDTYKIPGTLFVPLAGKDGYSASYRIF